MSDLYAFFLAYFVASIGVGFWLGRRWILWRLTRLEMRLAMQRMEIRRLSGKVRLGL